MLTVVNSVYVHQKSAAWVGGSEQTDGSSRSYRDYYCHIVDFSSRGARLSFADSAGAQQNLQSILQHVTVDASVLILQLCLEDFLRIRIRILWVTLPPPLSLLCYYKRHSSDEVSSFSSSGICRIPLKWVSLFFPSQAQYQFFCSVLKKVISRKTSHINSSF